MHHPWHQPQTRPPAHVPNGQDGLLRPCIDAEQVHSRKTLHALPPLRSAEIAKRLRSLEWVNHVLFVDPELLHVALEPLGAKLKLPSSMYN